MFSLVIFPIGSCPECSRGRGLGPCRGPLGPHGPGPNGPPWALMGQALARPLGPCGPGPCGPPGPL